MNPRGDLVFQVLDLPPEGIEVSGEVDFADLDIQDDGVFTFPTPLRFALNVSPVQDGVLVRGRLEAQVSRVCDRCLEPSDLAVAVGDVCHHYEHVAGGVVDLTDAVREDILLAFPQAWLCRAECRGLCPQCGRNLNEGTCTCEPSAPGDDEEDDPWGALDDLVVRDDK